MVQRKKKRAGKAGDTIAKPPKPLPATAAEWLALHLPGTPHKILKDPELRRFVDESIRSMSLHQLARESALKFGGARAPSKSALHRYWLRIKGATRAAGAEIRPAAMEEAKMDKKTSEERTQGFRELERQGSAWWQVETATNALRAFLVTLEPGDDEDTRKGQIPRTGLYDLLTMIHDQLSRGVRAGKTTTGETNEAI